MHLRGKGQAQGVVGERAGPTVAAGPRAPASVVAADAGGGLLAPALCLLSALGVLLAALAYTGARSDATWAEPLFWGALLVVFAPPALGLLAASTRRAERIALVIAVGLGLYLVKVLHSPLHFTFHDELLHWHTATDILRSGRLFQPNPLLPVSARYPGLELVVTAVAQLSGLGLFEAGLIVVGAARLALVVGLFLFMERVAGSARLAGVATLLYMANPNFVFFNAMMSYESLALPLVAVALVASAGPGDWGVQTGGHRWAGLLVAAALVMTHHLTSLALIGLLTLWAFLSFHERSGLDLPAVLRETARWYGGETSFAAVRESVAQQRRRLRLSLRAPRLYRAGEAPLALWAFLIVATAAWMALVSPLVIEYVLPHFRRATAELFGVVARQRPPGRTLFVSSSLGEAAPPILERITGVASAVLIVLGLPFGLAAVWRRHRHRPLALTMAAVGLAYPVSLALRLTGAGWEIGNRSSAFLFVGVAFALAALATEAWPARRLGRWWPPLAAAAGALILSGGVIAGWPPAWRLPRPYIPAAITRSIEAQGLDTAAWMRAYLGPDRRIGADRTNELLMGAYGDQHVVHTLSGSVNTGWTLFAPDLGPDEIAQIREGAVEYFVVDRRLEQAPAVGLAYYPETPIAEALAKFEDAAGVSKIYDSGAIAIYDMRAIAYGP